jgi:hypothetical protein
MPLCAAQLTAGCEPCPEQHCPTVESWPQASPVGLDSHAGIRCGMSTQGEWERGPWLCDGVIVNSSCQLDCSLQPCSACSACRCALHSWLSVLRHAWSHTVPVPKGWSQASPVGSDNHAGIRCGVSAGGSRGSGHWLCMCCRARQQLSAGLLAAANALYVVHAAARCTVGCRS